MAKYMVTTKKPIRIDNEHLIAVGTTPLPEGLEDHWYIEALREDGEIEVFIDGDSDVDDSDPESLFLDDETDPDADPELGDDSKGEDE